MKYRLLKVLLPLILFVSGAAAIAEHNYQEPQDGSIVRLISAAASQPILFVFIGESNSTGLATNTYPTTHELSVRPAVQLLDHVSLDSFWNLHVGVNNQIENVQFSGTNPLTGTPYWYSTHGWELQLANRAEAGDFRRSTVYLAKCGQGGTVIANWDSNASYLGISPYQVAVKRIDSARNIIFRATHQWPQTIVFYNQGINNSGIDTATWHSKTVNLFSRLRRDVGVPDMPIEFLDFSSMGPDYYGYIIRNNLPNEITNFKAVSSFGATPLLADGIHWEYAAVKTNANRLIDTALRYYIR